MKKEELQAEIAALESKIQECQDRLAHLYREREELLKQEVERKRYISSKEIIDLIYERTGKQSNMSMIKRWSDDGLLGEVVDEKVLFWALRSKQGKKRFLYQKKYVYAFLYEKGYLKPTFDVLDRVSLVDGTAASGIVINSQLHGDQFTYTIQLEDTGQVRQNVEEKQITWLSEGV
ncbi:hypothetical protein EDM56_21425 [Brevibacillus fluminis]|uniref:Uncharacterized protein n=1 Tax=Brevibacillus fluminis TaxID=511487 RepID=A0A3M8D9M9_9BACL|nr:hypothetical protein [Brevibacillus fluminis]RNB84668.1 hypothetical protein EDM56_21425 [Brevibacillus fluminis]